jgi:hypothetical protein
MNRLRPRRPSPAMTVALLALFIAVGGTGYASGVRVLNTGAATSKAKQQACVSAPALCRNLRSAVDREIAAYVHAHRSQLAGPTGAHGAVGAVGAAGAAGAAGSAGATGVPGVGIGGLFGNGADGSQTISGNTTLTRDTYYADLTLAPGVTLNPGGFRVFVSGTLTLQGGSRISRDGVDATTGEPAMGLVPGTLGGSAPGASTGLCLGGSVVNSLGGVGGSGPGCPGGAVSPPGPTAGGAQAFDAAAGALSGKTLDGTIVSGGSGGGGGTSATGNGGGGGGVLLVAARNVVVSGAASITANGGANAGDGGGGGGGVAIVVSASAPPAGLTLSAAGGGSGARAGHEGLASWLS